MSRDDDDDSSESYALARPSQDSLAPEDEAVIDAASEVMPAEQMSLPMGMMLERIEHRESMSGPLPPPQMLADYERAIPGTAAKIISWAEAESLHRRRQDDRDAELMGHCMRDQLAIQRLGMYFGLTVALAGLLATVILAALGKEWVAGIVGALDIVGLVSVFVYGRHIQSKRQAPAPRRPKANRPRRPAKSLPAPSKGK